MTILEQNLTYLSTYPFWDNERRFPVVEPLSLGEDYYTYEYMGEVADPLHIPQPNSDKMLDKPYFLDLTKPLEYTDLLDINAIRYLELNVRASEDYGEDNHIYLRYTSPAVLFLFLQLRDLTPYLASQKFIFLLVGEPSPYTFTYSGEPRPYRLDEINRLIVCTYYAADSGITLLDQSLNDHPNLLTGRHYLFADFYYIYHNLLKGRTLAEAAYMMIHTDNYGLQVAVGASFPIDINTPEEIRHKVRIQDFKQFLENMAKLVPTDVVLDELTYFKAFFLAYNMVKGISYKERITPAIKLQIHHVAFPANASHYHSVYEAFPYVKILMPLRRPVAAVRAYMRACLTRLYKTTSTPAAYSLELISSALTFNRLGRWCIGSYTPYPNYASFHSLFVHRDFSYRKYIRSVRFEDLKLYPAATLDALTKFLDIPLDDILFKQTENYCLDTEHGQDPTFAKGFDTRTVYAKYEDAMAAFDVMRMELIYNNDFAVFGYANEEYQGERYSKAEILAMFEQPFKCEEYYFSDVDEETKKEKRRILMDYVEKYLELRELAKRGLLEGYNAGVPIELIQPTPELVTGELYH